MEILIILAALCALFIFLSWRESDGPKHRRWKREMSRQSERRADAMSELAQIKFEGGKWYGWLNDLDPAEEALLRMGYISFEPSDDQPPVTKDLWGRPAGAGGWFRITAAGQNALSDPAI